LRMKKKGKKSVQKDDAEPTKSKKVVPKNDEVDNDDGETSKKSKSRISTVQSDPVFHEMRKRDKKVKVDSRFKAMFEDERFASTTAKVDRHGRPINKLKNREDLRNLYELEEDSDSSDKDNNKVEEKEEPTIKAKLKQIDLARGEGNISSSSEDDEEYSGDDLDDEEGDKLGIHDKWGELDHGVRKVEWTSKRLAVCNLDWEKMTAEDIFVALESFKPEEGQIVSVEVYLSDFGAEQLNYEEAHGPKLPEPSKNVNESDESDNEDAKPEAIRAYQFDRFRFYYAVVAFDSDETANAIYENCDGVQYQSSGLALDLRFVPDEMEFDKTRLRDQCLPDSVNLRKYKPNHFQSSVTQSNVKLDWDNSDFHRQKKVQKAFEDDANLDDLTGLIASGSDNDEERDEEDEGASLLLSAVATSNVYTNKSRNDEDYEMEAEKEPKAPKKKSKLKMKLVTKKKRKLADMATNLPANLDDTRFSSLYSNSEFAIDKTNPHYKGGVLADRQVQEKIRRKK